MHGHVRTINTMREMWVGEPIHLRDAQGLFAQSKLYHHLPHMLVVKTSNGRKVQLFPCGKLQVLGNLSHSVALFMICEVVGVLQKLNPNYTVNPLKLINLVAAAQLKAPVALQRINSSSSTLFYESELFPAALLRQWKPAHVAVFHNGKCVLSGCKTLAQAESIFQSLSEYLEDMNLFSLKSCT